MTKPWSLKKLRSQTKKRIFGKKYSGLRSYWRIFEVTRVIAKLSLYLYLDQYEVHRAAAAKHESMRMGKAARLTRLAVYGEKLYEARKWFFFTFVGIVRRVYLGPRQTANAIRKSRQSG
jgi:hypothetical protein